jgi:light-regulated signal transduction histidine kinase (bacteriophytochrome)
MLNLSRLTRGQLSIEDHVNLSEIAGEIADNLHARQPERQVIFEIEEGLEVRGDRRLLQAVMENLLDNAWKYTSRHPSARIEFGRTWQNKVPVYFVKDDGAGFDMAYADKLFGAFQRLHGTAEFPGTGVGLATVARIIHRHGGIVWAEAAVEKGATFFFTLGAANLEEITS